MKKTYIKPALFAESFQLLEHITSGCESALGYAHAHMTLSVDNPCAFEFDGETLFTNYIEACRMIRDEEDVGAGIYCYNVHTFEVYAFQTS